MVAIWIILSLCLGIVIGHFVWPKIKKEIIKVNVDVPVEKIVKEEVVVRPNDYDEYLKWAEHKDAWINLKTMIPDITVQDDDKFDRIMQVIEKELKTTEDGEFGAKISKRKKKN